MREVNIHEFAALRADGAYVVDVRETHEYLAGHVPGVELAPMGEVHTLLNRLPRREPVYVICRSGNRSAHIAALLNQAGVEAANVAGGMNAWEAAGYPVVRGAASDVA